MKRVISLSLVLMLLFVVTALGEREDFEGDLLDFPFVGTWANEECTVYLRIEDGGKISAESIVTQTSTTTTNGVMALQTLHPLRLEEVLGLKWKDIRMDEMTIHIERAMTHPDRNRPLVKATKTESSRRIIDLVPQVACYLARGSAENFVLGGREPLSYTQVRRMCQRIEKDTGFDESISPRRFRTTVLTDLYDATKDIKQAQAAAGHTTAAMTLKYYVKGRQEHTNSAAPIARAYGLED